MTPEAIAVMEKIYTTHGMTPEEYTQLPAEVRTELATQHMISLSIEGKWRLSTVGFNHIAHVLAGRYVAAKEEQYLLFVGKGTQRPECVFKGALLECDHLAQVWCDEMHIDVTDKDTTLSGEVTWNTYGKWVAVHIMPASNIRDAKAFDELLQQSKKKAKIK